MARLSLLARIGNAAAVLFGSHGDVSDQARAAGCSRQTVYDHAELVRRAVEDAHLPGPSRPQLLQEAAQLREENRQLWDWIEQAIDCPVDKQRQFTVTACAMGLSLTQALVLLAIFLPADRLPSRATLGRWVNRSARRAGRVLQVLDNACRGLVLCLCLDEIFFRRKPVLMAVEPHSLAWVLGQRAADRSGETWAKALAAWPLLEDVAADGGTGIQRGLDLTRAQRLAAAREAATSKQAVPIHARLDLFHLRRDGARALRQQWARAEASWDEAVKIERAKGRFDRQGADKRQFKRTKVEKAWSAAVVLFEQVCRQERAWGRVVAALKVFRPDGQLNERAWAEAQLREAAAELLGPAWAKVRRQLQDDRALTFLDRLREDLEEAEPCPERRLALAALWRWRREDRRQDPAGTGGVADQAFELLVACVKTRLGEDWEQAYRRVSVVLKAVVRGSSAVECVNSVVRMHQSRHRNLSQELLDLKRLYWNCRTFVEGKRKKNCPYRLLGLHLPCYDPWIVLQMDPPKLEQLLSSSGFTV